MLVAWHRVILAVLFFGAATVVYTFPLALRPGSLLLAGVGDHPSEAALIGWTAHQLLHAPWHLSDTEFFYPHSHTEAYWQSVLVPGILAMPVMAATGDALLATNVLVLVALTLSGLFAAGLAWSLTRQAAPSVLAGIVFAYFPNRLEHLNTPMVQMGFLLPVILWAYLRFLAGTRWRDLLVLVLALWGQSLSSLYYAFAAGFLLLAVGLGHVLLRPDTISWRLVTRSAVGAVALALALAPFLAPYWVVHQSLGFDRPEELADLFGMDLLSWLDPGSFSTLYRHLRPHRSEGGLFAGVMVLALVGAAFVLAVRPGATTRRHRWAAWARAGLLTAGGLCLIAIILAAREHGIAGRVLGFKLRLRDATLPVHALPILAYAWTALEGRRGASGMSRRDWLLVLAPATLVMYLLCLTSTLTILDRPRGIAPFHWVYTYVPGAAAFRAPGRWALVFALPLALVAALGLAALMDRIPRRARRPAAVAAVLLVMVECLPLPLPWGARPPVPPVHRWLAQQPGDFAVAVLPANDGGYAAWTMLWATSHWKRLVNGAFVFVPPTLEALAEQEESADLATLVETLQSIYPVRYLIVNQGLLTPAERAAWARLEWDHSRGLAVAGRFPPDDVYSVTGTPQQGVVLNRWFSADFVGRYPLAVYSLAFTDAERAIRRRIEVRFNGRLVATHETPVQAVVSLESPYRTGDRNELTFTHFYDLDPATTSGPAYRIGRTAAYAPVDIQAVSAAKPHGNRASIRVNGLEVSPRPARGYVIAALDGRSGKPVGVRWFDTFISTAESRRMASFIDGLAPGTIVVAAVRDEGGGQLEASGVRALQSIGAREDLRGRLWESHVVIGVKGAAPGDAIEAAGPRLVQASVGQTQALEMVLESFALR